MKKILIFAVVLAVVIGGGWFAFSKFGGAEESATPENVVATVNGQELTVAQLDVIIKQIAEAQGILVPTLKAEEQKALRDAAMDALVGQILIEQAVASASSAPTAAEVETEVATIKERFATEEEFTAALETEDITLEGLRARITNDVATQRYLTSVFDASKLAVTQEEVAAAYERAVAGVTDAPTLEDSYAQIELALVQQKQQSALTELVAELRAGAVIEIK